MKLFLLAVGIDSYADSNIRNLQYCENDARAIYSAFEAALDPAAFNGTLVINADATLCRIKMEFGERLSSLAAKEDTVILYYAGHGGIDSPSGSQPYSNYLIPYDGDYKHFYSTCFDLKRDLENAMSRIKSENVTLILDCCHSGGSSATGVRGITGYNAHLTNLVTDGNPNSRVIGANGKLIELGVGFASLMACGPDQYAQEDSTLQHGVFTYYILHSLSSTRPDQSISSAELHAEVTRKVNSFTLGRQTPYFEARVQAHNVVTA